jgi:hypothetical protein
MQKLPLILFLLIFCQQVHCQSEHRFISRIEININQRHIQRLNEIENVVLETADKYRKNEIPLNELQFLSSYGISTHLTSSEISIGEEKLMTNNYELILLWDSTISKAMIYGFSRKYVVKQKKYLNHKNLKTDEIVTRRLFLIPFYYYSSILTVDDHNFLNEVIKEYIKGIISEKSLVNYIYKGVINDCTIRKIPILKYNNTSIDKLTDLNYNLVWDAKNGRSYLYKTPNIKDDMTRKELLQYLERNIVSEYNGVKRIDTVRSDEANNIAIFDKWTFFNTRESEKINLFDFSDSSLLKNPKLEISYFQIDSEFIGLDLPPNETSKNIERILWYHIPDLKDQKFIRIEKYLELLYFDALKQLNISTYNEAILNWYE